MKSTLLQRLFLILFGVVLALVIFIVVLPMVNPPPQTEGCEPHPIMGQVWELVDIPRAPCSREQFMWPPDSGDEYRNEATFNNFGLHAPVYTLEKAENVFRIVIVGDSFPQGVQVPLEQGFPWLLGEALSQDGQQVEVINLSVDAYGTDRELLLYALLGWQFQPDLVLLSVYPSNDVQDNQIDLEKRRYGYGIGRPFFTLKDGKLILHDTPVFDGSDYPDSAPYQWLVGMQASQLPPPPDNPPDRPAVVNRNPYALEYPVELGLYLPQDAHWMSAWNVTTALLLQFREVVAESGVPFGVVIIPDRRAIHDADWLATQTEFAQLHPDIWDADPLAPGTRLEMFLADHDIRVLNLTPALRQWAAEHPEQRLYFASDGHFNANGHTVTAAEIATWVNEQRFVP